MKTYQIQIKKGVKKDIEIIKDFIVKKTNREHALLYTAELYAEIESLNYLADCIKISEWKTGKRFSKKENVLVTKNKKWSNLFHTWMSLVMIDLILPSKMVND